MRIRIAEEQDITEIESLYSQLFSAMAALQPDFISPAFADRAFAKKLYLIFDYPFISSYMPV